VTRALRTGAAGFILFGGTAEAAREASRELTERAGRPLLLGADLERGAGQQFAGATPLPPLAALAALGDPSALVRAGEITGREAAAVGVPWVFAPVADLSVEPENPIVGTRSPGADPIRAGRVVADWIRGCVAGGGLPCVKHFPGHGRTLTDSHAELPVVTADAETLRTVDLRPFRDAVAAGVPSVMTAHVAYPALDPSGRPATRSGLIIRDLLRGELGFGGVVVTDALNMEGAGSAETAAAEALEAGVDLLLYPPEGLVPPALSPAGVERVRRLLDRVPAATGTGGWGAEEDRRWALETAERTLRLVPAGRDQDPSGANWLPGSPGRAGAEGDGRRSWSLTVVDDDVGGPWPPPSRDRFPETLRREGCELSEGGVPLLALYSDPRAWKGRAGLGPEAGAAVAAWCGHVPPEAPIVLFGGPGILPSLPPGRPVLLAWGGEPLMQEAAGRWLAGTGAAGR
jgi:beta-glucosidase